jgi:uncharacterized protein with NRDE domain
VCTLILATRVWPEAPLVVAANRDEALDRPSGPPRRYPLGERSVLAPEDKVGGGTWLGVNDQGLFVGITNRFGLPKDPARRSRGRLVEEALGYQSAAEAFEGLDQLSPLKENGFHLVLADRQAAFLIYNDGAQIHRTSIPAGLLVVTERSFDAGPTRRTSNIAKELNLMTGPKGPTWRAWRLCSEPTIPTALKGCASMWPIWGTAPAPRR